MNQTITTVLFDFDGTVFDTVEGITKSIQYALRKHGRDAALEDLRCFAGPPLVDKFMEVCGFTEEEAEQAVRDYRERYRPIGLYECRVFPGIKELLRDLREAGYTLGIATSKPQSMAEHLLGREGMLELFDAIAGTREGDRLTKADVLRSVMATLGAEAENTVLIGDTKYDVAGAGRVGIPCIGVRWGYAAPGELEEAGALGIVETPEELAQVLLACGPGAMK
jgi:phosphoglycolate phosphatase